MSPFWLNLIKWAVLACYGLVPLPHSCISRVNNSAEDFCTNSGFYNTKKLNIEFSLFFKSDFKFHEHICEQSSETVKFLQLIEISERNPKRIVYSLNELKQFYLCHCGE